MAREHRVKNFGAGPSALPLPVLERVKDELLHWNGTGRSIMEVSHRSREYGTVHESARSLFKELMGMDGQWHVLFLQGGATMQFAMAPMNLLGKGKAADYVLTGAWSRKAADHAAFYGKVKVAADSSENGLYTRLPSMSELAFDPNAAYCHLTTNNTIFGTQWKELPDTGKVPMVLDMSSDILTRTVPLERTGLIYAGAQKNLGPSGVCVVAIREDLLAKARKDLPPIFSYQSHVDKGSLLNTPPTFNVYVLGLVLEWVKDSGGPAEMERLSVQKAGVIYETLDQSQGFYVCPVEGEHRSLTNAVFRLRDERLESELLESAENNGFTGIKGHRLVGGFRVSMYNAVSLEDVEELASFLADFARSKG